MSRIRVLCVDDHLVVREGIAAILKHAPDLEIVATASDGEAAVTQYLACEPDVVLMDLRLPVLSGLEAMQCIRNHDRAARIIVLTMYEGDQDIRRAMLAGASAYLLKDTLADDLIRVIRRVHAGEMSPLAPVPSVAAKAVLTERESEIMHLVAKGMRNKEIASALRISRETVQVHLRTIFAKLGVHDRTAALAVAIQRGIVHV